MLIPRREKFLNCTACGEKFRFLTRRDVQMHFRYRRDRRIGKIG